MNELNIWIGRDYETIKSIDYQNQKYNIENKGLPTTIEENVKDTNWAESGINKTNQGKYSNQNSTDPSTGNAKKKKDKKHKKCQIF